MKPYHDRTLLPVFKSFCPDVRPEAILSGEAVIPAECESHLVALPSHSLCLRACRAIGSAAAYAFPVVCGDWRHEPFCLCIRYSLENIDIAVNISGNLTVFRNGEGVIVVGPQLAAACLFRAMRRSAASAGHCQYPGGSNGHQL